MTDNIHISITMLPLSVSADIPISEWAEMSDTERVARITQIVTEKVTPYAKVRATIAVPDLPKVQGPTKRNKLGGVYGSLDERRIAAKRPRTPDIDQLQWSTPRERDGQSQ